MRPEIGPAARGERALIFEHRAGTAIDIAAGGSDTCGVWSGHTDRRWGDDRGFGLLRQAGDRQSCAQAAVLFMLCPSGSSRRSLSPRCRTRPKRSRRRDEHDLSVDAGLDEAMCLGGRRER